MDLFEELVLWHLTRNGEEGMFVCPQYQIDGGACPDFVTISPSERTVSVVEVSAAYSVGGLMKKVADRESRWFGKLRKQLLERRVIDDSWKTFQVVLYVRDDVAPMCEEQFAGASDVSIRSLGKIGFPWEWTWSAQKAEKEAQERAH
jgi:hypothetical protein